jgi:CHASE2 domain-containing sensor protein
MKILRLIPLFFISIVLSCNSQHAEQNIVVINTDTLDRAGIANLIGIINLFNPKVIAIDIQFVNSTESSKDWLLFHGLNKCKSLVMASMIGKYTGEETEYRGFVEESEPQFLTNAKTGFVNSILERDGFETLKRFSTHEKVNGSIEYHFGVRTAMAFDSLKAIHFVESNPRVIDVDYRYGKRRFKSFSSSDVLSKRLSHEDIEGKIVMLGFLGPGDEDKFFTPLNTNSNEPDMYGLEYLANIVAQVLNAK